MGSKGSTRVDAADPFEIAEADALFNRIDQFTPLSSLQFFGPQRNQMVETLNPALQHTENQRLLSDIMLNNMALGRQTDMKGGSLPSLTPSLNPSAQQEFFGLPTHLQQGFDQATQAPPIPDFIGNFQQPGGGGVPGGGGAPNAPFQGYDPMVQRQVDQWMEQWTGQSDPLEHFGDFRRLHGNPIGGAIGDAIFGSPKEPKRGSLPGTLWETDAQGNILGNKGTGHYNPYLGQWVDRRGRPVANQQAAPEGFGAQAGTPQSPMAGAQPYNTGQVPVPGQFGGQMGATPGFAKGGQQAPQAAQQQAPQQQAPQQAKGGQQPQQQQAQSGNPLFGGTLGSLIGVDTFGLDQQGINRGRTEQAMFDRTAGLMSPQFDQAEQRMLQDLANRGIPRDSEAGRNELNNFRTNKAEAFNRVAQDAIGMGGQEVQRQQQALGQLFGMGNQLSQMDIATQMQNANIAQANRATQFNELASLLGLNQIAQPGLQNFFAPGQVDVGGAFALNQQAQTTNANNATQMKTGAMDAIGGLGGAAMGMSDRRLKKDIEYIGDYKGHKWYEFSYLWDDTKHVGVMSDEVPEEFVHKHPSGYDMVDYSRIL
jgi:hypothetical protein